MLGYQRAQYASPKAHPTAPLHVGGMPQAREGPTALHSTPMKMVAKVTWMTHCLTSSPMLESIQCTFTDALRPPDNWPQAGSQHDGTSASQCSEDNSAAHVLWDALWDISSSPLLIITTEPALLLYFLPSPVAGALGLALTSSSLTCRYCADMSQNHCQWHQIRGDD
jgi:hypothetical protein